MICAHCGSETAEAPCSGCARSPLLGGRYRLLSTIEQAEQERVYRGEDSRSGGAVLLRRIDTRRVDPAVLGQRLDTHLKPLFRIHHPGLPRRRRAETTDGAVWTIRQWVDGPSLPDRIASRGAFPLGEVLTATDRILEDLEVLHEQDPPYPHGALRPGNVRFDVRNRPVLLGRMGILPLLADPGHPSRKLREDTTGLAPEQRGDEASVRADIYAAGAVCIAMLTGRPASSLKRSGRIAWEQAVTLPAQLGQWLDRMIDPAPGRRPESAATARARLRDACAGLPDALLSQPAPDRKAAAPVDEELPTMVVREELPTTVMQSPLRAAARPEWPHPDATPSGSGRRPAPTNLAPTSIGRRPTAAEIEAAQPTSMGRRPTLDDLGASEPTTMARRPSRDDIAAAEPTTIGQRPTLDEPTPAPPTPRATPGERTTDAPTDRAPRLNPFDQPTGFARRASEIEHTGPRPPTQVRPHIEPRRGSVFENPVFVAVGLALLGVALWQVVSRLGG